MKEYANVRHIVDMRPGGLYVMVDLDRVGGVPLILKSLLKQGLIHGDALTVSGRTMEENLEMVEFGTSTRGACNKEIRKTNPSARNAQNPLRYTCS